MNSDGNQRMNLHRLIMKATYSFLLIFRLHEQKEPYISLMNRHSNGLGGMSLPGLLFADRKPHIPSILFLRIFPIFMDGDYDIMILYY